VIAGLWLSDSKGQLFFTLHPLPCVNLDVIEGLMFPSVRGSLHGRASRIASKGQCFLYCSALIASGYEMPPSAAQLRAPWPRRMRRLVLPRPPYPTTAEGPAAAPTCRFPSWNRLSGIVFGRFRPGDWFPHHKGTGCLEWRPDLDPRAPPRDRSERRRNLHGYF